MSAVNRALDLPAARPDERLLDVGTGTGEVLRRLARRPVRPREAIGIDASAAMLARVGTLPRGWNARRGDALSLPFANSELRVCWSNHRSGGRRRSPRSSTRDSPIATSQPRRPSTACCAPKRASAAPTGCCCASRARASYILGDAPGLDGVATRAAPAGTRPRPAGHPDLDLREGRVHLRRAGRRRPRLPPQGRQPPGPRARSARGTKAARSCTADREQAVRTSTETAVSLPRRPPSLP